MPRRSRFEPEGSRSLRGSSSKSYQAPIIVGAMCGRTQASFNGPTCILDRRLHRTCGIGGLASVSVGAFIASTFHRFKGSFVAATGIPRILFGVFGSNADLQGRGVEWSYVEVLSSKDTRGFHESLDPCRFFFFSNLVFDRYGFLCESPEQPLEDDTSDATEPVTLTFESAKSAI